jgi:hypothetical protein
MNYILIIETQKQTHEESSLVNANDEDRTAKGIFCWLLSPFSFPVFYDSDGGLKVFLSPKI